MGVGHVSFKRPEVRGRVLLVKTRDASMWGWRSDEAKHAGQGDR